MRTSAGFFMPENPCSYLKRPLSYEDLLARFASRGLLISDPSKAVTYLQNISYFRLTGYGLAFEKFSDEKQRLHQFKEGASFDGVLRAYIIDRKIRLLIIDAIERIEVSIRGTINHEMSCSYDNPHWYMTENLFVNSDHFKHHDFIRQIRTITARNADPDTDKQLRREQFIDHYYSQYNDPDLPPCWMIAEVLSLGSWSKVFNHLKESRDKKRISKQYNLSPVTMDSWLHALTYLRNLCAHHSRIYYRPLVIKPKQDKDLPFDPVNRFSTYAAVIYWFLLQINPSSSWYERLFDLLSELPLEEHIHYGFTSEWWDRVLSIDCP